MSDLPFDLVVLGGGSSGIVSARLYLDIHPNANVIVIERDEGPGGTWSRERSYPGFKAQATCPMCQFSDVPIEVPEEGVDELGYPESKYVSEYMENYLDKHVYEGVSLRARFRFNTLVTKVEKSSDSLWHVHITQADQETELTTRKIIVATGTTSIPNIPYLKNRSAFKGRVLHSIDFGREYASLTSPTTPVSSIVVIGGGKSSADMIYQLAKAEKYTQIIWLFRKSGKGPTAFIKPDPLPGFKTFPEAATTRLFAQFVLSGLKEKGWWDWFFWDTWFGSQLQGKFDDFVSRKFLKAGDFDRKEAREGFKLLKNTQT
jgi:dimethylaniline monooxygenase (N-oxide forming)